jgi:ribosomal protein L11 methyltransferase
MSFGTGHHETTRLMIKAMSLLDLSGLKVLDMGAGTGILGIYALKSKAGRVCSVDVDDWAIENCQENFIRNACPASSWITVQAGSPEQLDSFSPDIILANINRNILIEHLPGYARLLPGNGILLLSGIYDSDREVVIREAGHNGLEYESVLKENAWICLKFRKLGD